MIGAYLMLSSGNGVSSKSPGWETYLVTIFECPADWSFIKILIVDDEEYEKTEHFTIVLEEPQLVKKGSVPPPPHSYAKERFISASISAVKFAKYSKRKGEDVDSGAVVNSEDDRMAEMGKPRLGELTKTTIRIKESQEFKSTVDKLLKKANVSLVVGTSSWREQFVEAITVSAEEEKPSDPEPSSFRSSSNSSHSASSSMRDDDADDEDGEESEEKLPSCMDYVMHFLTLFWKIMFAFVPPTDYGGGWWCFCVSIILIGVLTAFIGDLASSFGCTVGLKDAVTAISFVALGTSVPDTFASKVAAIGDRYADSSIGNVTGSNAVNVFLGIGIAWTIAAVYHAINGDKFYVPTGQLALSVTVFCIMAGLTILILLARRHPSVGGELGGPMKFKLPTTIVLVCFWLIYVLISSFTSYCYIPGF
ncbi:hypothetical protein RRG08_025768 [Elysia crispata]|uniref:Sodium/calcium exchanger 1 n=1 Tax=Elysia crispata TaxID=231223 RepID=A0AAE1AH19_9GAST|nr:hypothetical protein RRG08_025768 [Elysia crispata]